MVFGPWWGLRLVSAGLLCAVTLTLPVGVLAEVVGHAQADYPIEACGLIAGPAGQVETATRIIPLRNASPEPDREFTFDPDEQLGAYQVMDALGEDPVVVYHSHPTGPAVPSATDRAHASAGSVWLIVSLTNPADPVARAWRVRGGVCDEIGLIVEG